MIFLVLIKSIITAYSASPPVGSHTESNIDAFCISREAIKVSPFSFVSLKKGSLSKCVRMRRTILHFTLSPPPLKVLVLFFYWRMGESPTTTTTTTSRVNSPTNMQAM